MWRGAGTEPPPSVRRLHPAGTADPDSGRIAVAVRLSTIVAVTFARFVRKRVAVDVDDRLRQQWAGRDHETAACISADHRPARPPRRDRLLAANACRADAGPAVGVGGPPERSP